MSFAYEYERPSLAVDCVVFGVDMSDLKVMLIERGVPPFQGHWALPGGFVKPGEPLDMAAMRELQEETGIEQAFLEQLYTFGDKDRDPRGWTVTVAYYALVNLSDHTIQATTDAHDAQWFPVDDMPPLAFDHGKIFNVALERLRGKLRYQPIGFELLPKKFTLSQLQKLYEIVLKQELDKRNFRKKILSMGLLIDLNETQKDVAHRAARLYSFDETRYFQLKEHGFNFEI